ncbi:MAG TPA: hypothetical protein VK945_14420 [Planococcus sp. (in: firmicutes)]|nr:hypothetical protein [Planococcus sp. (in: firmicutes)]
MAQRTGIPSILKTAQILCRLLTDFTPIITLKYGNNPSLLAALAAANAACAVLVQETAAVREYGD